MYVGCAVYHDTGREGFGHPAENEREGATMKHLRLLGIALLAIFALGAVAAATASALEPGLLYLEKGKGPFKFSVTGGGGHLAAGASTVKCTKITGTGESKEEKHVILGLGTLDFTGCKIEKAKVTSACNSEGDAKETILVPIDWHLINVLEKEKLEPGIAVLPLPLEGFHFVCAAGTVLVLVRGWFDGLILTTNLTTDIETAEVHFFLGGEICDDVLCKELLEKEPPEANITGTFEKATLEQLATITWSPDMLVDD
jgi:hypothetical protein